MPSPGKRLPSSAWSRLAVLALLLAALAVVTVAYEPQRFLAADQWSERVTGPGGAVLFTVVYGVAAAAFVPRPLMGVTAGALFGAPLGTLVALGGTVLGAALCLGLGRWLGQDSIRPLLRGRWVREGDRQLADHGFRSVAALRLLPGVPFAPSNYVMAMSRVRWPIFLGASAIGSIPQTLVFAFAGSQATEPSSTLLAVAGLLVAAPLATIAVARYRSVRSARRSPATAEPSQALA